MGRQAALDVGELILHSTGDFLRSVASIRRGASVFADRVSMRSGNRAVVGADAQVHVAGELEMEAESPAKCRVGESAVISYGTLSGSCAPAFEASAADMASLLTYLRREWGHGADPVTAAFIESLRAEVGHRPRPFSPAELGIE